jgi:hypothetical protein
MVLVDGGQRGGRLGVRRHGAQRSGGGLGGNCAGMLQSTTTVG